MKVAKRVLVSLLAIALIVIRAVLPDLRLDEISLALFAVICLAILWPDLGKLPNVVRKLRFGSFEVELAEKVEKLSEQAEKAEEAQATEETHTHKAEEIPSDVAKRIAEAGSDPRSALLLVAIEIEQAIRRLAEKHALPSRTSTTRLTTELASRQIISKETLALFRDFWQVRNQVVHRAGFDVPAGQIYQLVDIGLTILKLLSSGDDSEPTR